MVFFAAHLRAKGEEFRAALAPADRQLLRASKIALLLCIFLPFVVYNFGTLDDPPLLPCSLSHTNRRGWPLWTFQACYQTGFALILYVHWRTGAGVPALIGSTFFWGLQTTAIWTTDFSPQRTLGIPPRMSDLDKDIGVHVLFSLIHVLHYPLLVFSYWGTHRAFYLSFFAAFFALAAITPTFAELEQKTGLPSEFELGVTDDIAGYYAGLAKVRARDPALAASYVFYRTLAVVLEYAAFGSVGFGYLFSPLEATHDERVKRAIRDAKRNAARNIKVS